jgi:hypothetical protein
MRYIAMYLLRIAGVMLLWLVILCQACGSNDPKKGNKPDAPPPAAAPAAAPAPAAEPDSKDLVVVRVDNRDQAPAAAAKAFLDVAKKYPKGDTRIDVYHPGSPNPKGWYYEKYGSFLLSDKCKEMIQKNAETDGDWVVWMAKYIAIRH